MNKEKNIGEFHYSECHSLGSGVSGSVYKGIFYLNSLGYRESDQTPVAVKLINEAIPKTDV